MACYPPSIQSLYAGTHRGAEDRPPQVQSRKRGRCSPRSGTSGWISRQCVPAWRVTKSVVLVYATGPGQLIDLLEHTAAGKTLPAGDAVAIHQPMGRITLSGATTFLFWMEHRTWPEIHTRLDRQQMLQFANRLQVSPLTSFASSEAAAALRVQPTPVPLAQRIAEVETAVAPGRH